MITPRNRRQVTGTAFATATLLAALVAPTTAQAEPQGHVASETGVGYFYGTFGDGPQQTLLVGGTAEEFCLDNPDDPFAAEPGAAPLRIFFRSSGAVDLKVDDNDQPIYLYEDTEGEAPEWIGGVCADLFDDDPATTVPQPAATGSAHLKVRISVVSDDLVEVFNSVNGELVATDGSAYRVRASADLVVEDGMPVGDPADFVRLVLTEIRRR